MNAARTTTARDELLLAREAADWLRVPESTLAQWRRDDRGPDWVRVGRRVMYARSAIETYIETHSRRMKDRDT